MFKPTQALSRKFRKLRLTTKDINKGFYKGTGTGNVGTHDKWGGFRIDYTKVRTYAVPPGLDTFKVRISPIYFERETPADFELTSLYSLRPLSPKT
jgi:large subunit ribosomal protein L41